MDSPLVYDVGMNNGDDSAYYLHKGYRVVAIEADPTLVEDATNRFAQEIRDGRLTILNVAVAEQEGILPFWICEAKREWNSFDRAMASRNGYPHHKIDVQCVRFTDVLGDYDRPFYLKIDIEGHDHLCLDALDDKPDKRPRYLSFESTPEAVAKLPQLTALGYDSFKLISQRYFTSIQPGPIPNRQQLEVVQRRDNYLSSGKLAAVIISRAGGQLWLDGQLNRIRRKGDWEFPMGSSGPFGEELPGEWQSCEQITSLLDSVSQVTPQKPLHGFWSEATLTWLDVHARLKDD